ncbi:MAG: prohibitin family protein [Capsulimonas sp.]|uniref:prohibitin family protein n=1 Tax=Capsulimonas sp. TaxID=2494211 RepID=UPI0032670D38
MFLVVLGVLLLLVAIAAPAQLSQGGANTRAQVRKVCGALGTLLLVGGVLSSSYMSVPAGYRGVLLQFGAVNGVLGEGAHFIMPFAQTVDLMEVRTQKTEAIAAASSKDLQVVKADVAINFHVDPVTLGKLYREVGPDYADRIINPAVQETLKAVVARYTAEELIRLRDRVKTEVDQNLATRLLAYNIIVEPNGVSLKNFDFSDEFNSAIEQKQVAQQNSEKQKYILAQANLEAQTAVTTAKGEAEANKIKAQALNTQGGQKVLAREWITKWDGHLPQVQTGAGGGTIIDLKSLLSDKPAKDQ